MGKSRIVEYAKLNDERRDLNNPSFEVAQYDYKLALSAFNERDLAYGLELTKKAKGELERLVKKKGWKNCQSLADAVSSMGGNIPETDLWWDILLTESPMLFDSYMIYLEKDRKPEDRFYAPRKTCLDKTGIIQDLQDLEDDKLDMLSISLPPGTGKTTLEKFFASWIIGRHPEDFSIFFSHSDDITRMFYDGVLEITTNNEEYKWHDIFPTAKLQKTDAGRQQINFGKAKPFWSLQCSSLGSKNAGKIRANRYLFIDDLIGGITEALNINILDRIWTIYSTDMRQRRLNGRVKELHIGTRWSVKDVIGRLKALYSDDKRRKFVSVPDIDPETGESNFDYEINGLTVEHFNDIAKTMDPISYRCLFKNEPIEREGLLYHEDELRRYLSLPDREPDEITAQCDCKAKGTDYMVMLVLARYGEDYYCIDCVCSNNPDYEYQYQSLANILVRNRVQSCEFESNQGGDRVALEVSKRVDGMGWVCNITDKPTETNKEARIYQFSNWIKQKILFKSENMYSSQEDYGIMMMLLLSYSISGKNLHDDVPDCFANFASRIKRARPGASVAPIRNPFRYGLSYEDIWG